MEPYFQKAAIAIEKWLASRRGSPSISADIGAELVPIGAGYQAAIDSITVDGVEARRWRIRVGAEASVYDTRVTVAVHPESQTGWLQYDIEAGRDDSAFMAPRLTSTLTTELESRTADSIANFSEGLRVVRKEGVGDFLDDVLNNPRRTVTAFVTGSRVWTDEQDRAFERRFSALHGVATFWRLADDAIDEFNTLVQAGYQVYPGSVHVFQPNLDTEDQLDARRHWWFSAAEVADTSEKAFWMRLHNQAMRWALHQPLPANLQLVAEGFARAHSNALANLFSPTLQQRRQEAIVRLRGARTAEVTTHIADRPTARTFARDSRTELASVGSPPQAEVTRTDSATALAAILEVLIHAEALLEIKSTQEREPSDRVEAVFMAALDQSVGSLTQSNEARREIEQLFARAAKLESEVEELSALLVVSDDAHEEAHGDLQHQRRIAEQQRRRADHMAAELGRVTRGAEDVRWATPAPVADDPINRDAPTTVDALFDQLASLSFVRFTGNRKHSERIGRAKLRSVILADAWTFACELELYARQWEQGVQGLSRYAEETSARITPGSFAHDESSDVKSNPKFCAPRTLPVPTAVDPSGEVFMGAHFRLSQDNGKAMRMHVHDAMQTDGRVYIGYIGEHLPSRLTT